MNIIVCAKQVVDVSEMKVDSSTGKPILQGVPQKISDIDKNAMEEAIKIKEKQGGKITVVTVGPTDAKERIKELLAMGADEGVLVTSPEKLDYHVVSSLLAGASFPAFRTHLPRTERGTPPHPSASQRTISDPGLQPGP